MVENLSFRGVGAPEPICRKIKSLTGDGAAEPIWWKIKALEGWGQRSQYGGKSEPCRGECSGPNMVENHSLRGVSAAEPIKWKIKALEGCV